MRILSLVFAFSVTVFLFVWLFKTLLRLGHNEFADSLLRERKELENSLLYKKLNSLSTTELVELLLGRQIRVCSFELTLLQATITLWAMQGGDGGPQYRKLLIEYLIKSDGPDLREVLKVN